MPGRKPEPTVPRPSMVLAALLGLAILCGPLISAAQTSTDKNRDSSKERAQEAAERRKREATERNERAQTQQREAAEQRARQDAERRDRERWERQENTRRQNAMRDADKERAAARERQNAAWERDMQRQRQATLDGKRPAAAPGAYTIPGNQGAPARSPIVSRCQAANAPDPCNTDVRLSFGGGCAQQCAAAATCAAGTAR
jgi:hypothetical protein